MVSGFLKNLFLCFSTDDVVTIGTYVFAAQSFFHFEHPLLLIKIHAIRNSSFITIIIMRSLGDKVSAWKADKSPVFLKDPLGPASQNGAIFTLQIRPFQGRLLDKKYKFVSFFVKNILASI